MRASGVLVAALATFSTTTFAFLTKPPTEQISKCLRAQVHAHTHTHDLIKAYSCVVERWWQRILVKRGHLAKSLIFFIYWNQWDNGIHGKQTVLYVCCLPALVAFALIFCPSAPCSQRHLLVPKKASRKTPAMVMFDKLSSVRMSHAVFVCPIHHPARTDLA